MEERFDDVKREHAETFKWIFENHQENDHQENNQQENEQQENEQQWNDQQEDDPPAPQTKVPFIKWLRSGSGIFHIEGKAGSGKSTLMKFILKNPRTMESLESWAGEKQLVFGQFFFWKPGTQLQRSLKGLTRALLYSILEQAPELIETTFPEMWRNIRVVPWNVPCDIQFTLVDIQDAFVRLIRNETIYESRRFCFFIDGLDEFDESNGLDPEHQTCYTDLIKIFSSWTRNRPDVKLCVSSRDWNLFKEAFSAHQRLRLQDLTKNDMKVLVQDSLEEHGRCFHSVSGADPQFVELVEQIVEKAEGVFLWMALVLKSLRQGLQYKDSAKTLRGRLEKMPVGLENFLGFMFESIDPIYLQQSARIFSVAMAASKISSRRDLSLLRYSFLEDLESNPRFALEEIGLLSDRDLKDRLERMRFQLDACCKGLLEARRADDEDLPGALHEQVTFLHRSVQDFLEENNDLKDTEMVQKIKKKIADKVKDIGVLNLISHTFLAQIKSVEFDHKEIDALGYDLGDVVRVIHQAWSETRCLDFELLDALDTVLRRPKCGVTPDFRDCHTTYSRERCFVRKDIEICDDWVRFIDIFGTFAFHGFCEFLTGSTNRDTSLIYNRSVDYLLYFALFGFQSMETSTNVSDYFYLVELLLRQKANLNSVMFWNSYCSYTNWECFIYKIRSDKGIFEPDEDTAKMIQLLLEYGADPYVWILNDSSDFTLWFHAKKGVIFHNANAKDIPRLPKEPKSLRNLIEVQLPDNAKAILALLPSNSKYEREWSRSLKVSRRQARKLQGFPSGFEKKSDIHPDSDTEGDGDLTSLPLDKYPGRDSGRHSDGDLDGDSDGYPYAPLDQTSELVLDFQNDTQSTSGRPSPNLRLDFEDDCKLEPKPELLEIVMPQTTDPSAAWVLDGSQSGSRPTLLESHSESKGCGNLESRVNMEQTAKQMANLTADTRKEFEAAASPESKPDPQSLATLRPDMGLDIHAFWSQMYPIVKHPLFTFVIGRNASIRSWNRANHLSRYSFSGDSS